MRFEPDGRGRELNRLQSVKMAVLFLGFHDVDQDPLLLVYLHFLAVELHLQVLYLGVRQLRLAPLLLLLSTLLTKFMIFYQFPIQRDVPAGLGLHRQQRLYICLHFLYLLLELARPRLQGLVIRLPLQEAIGRVDDRILRSLLAHLSHQLAVDLLAGLGTALDPRRRLPANRFNQLCNPEQKGAVVHKAAAVGSESSFSAPEVGVQLGEDLTDRPYFGVIDPGLLFGQILLSELGGGVEEGPQLPLLELAVFAILEAFVCGEVVGGGEEGVADLVDNVLAGSLERGHQLGFHLVEVAVDRLLQQAALGLHRAIEGKFAQQHKHLLLREEQRMREVGVVLLETDLAGAHFLRLAGVAEAEVADAFAVLALIHLTIKYSNRKKARRVRGS